MYDGRFEWDDRKAAENAAKHAVTFEMARDIFDDPFALEFDDPGRAYGEDRYIGVGMVEGRLLAVVYTLRDEVIRIISARRAEPIERRRYHDENET